MSGKGAAFRIDVIVHSLNELRQEKGALEQRYIDEKSRNKSLEFKLEQDSMKFYQSKERNCKMHETVKLAEQKVAQTDSQADRLTEINEAKQKILADLNDKIKQEMDKQEDDVAHFQMKLLELTQFFRNAKQVYTKSTLDKEIMAWKENMETFVTEAEEKKIELTDMTKALENLSLDTDRFKELVDKKMGHEGLTYKDLRTTIDLLTRKQERIQRLLDWLVSCLSKASFGLQETGRENLMNGDVHLEMEKGQMDFAQEIYEKESTHYATQDCYSGFGTRQMELPQQVSGKGNTHATQDRYSGAGTRQMELAQEVSDKENTHYATQDRYSGFGTRQIEVTQEIPNEENSYYAVESDHSVVHIYTVDSQTAHCAEPVNQDAANIPTDNYRQTLQQSPFFISLPFSRSR